MGVLFYLLRRAGGLRPPALCFATLRWWPPATYWKSFFFFFPFFRNSWNYLKFLKFLTFLTFLKILRFWTFWFFDFFLKFLKFLIFLIFWFFFEIFGFFWLGTLCIQLEIRNEENREVVGGGGGVLSTFYVLKILNFTIIEDLIFYVIVT